VCIIVEDNQSKWLVVQAVEVTLADILIVDLELHWLPGSIIQIPSNFNCIAASDATDSGRDRGNVLTLVEIAWNTNNLLSYIQTVAVAVAGSHTNCETWTITLLNVFDSKDFWTLAVNFWIKQLYSFSFKIPVILSKFFDCFVFIVKFLNFLLRPCKLVVDASYRGVLLLR